ncbi:OsmC family protein [Spirochaeta dissipatitropha]
MRIDVERVNMAVHFRARNIDGQSIDIDGSEKIGGTASGMRPMEALLSALGSCAAMDLVSILKKQRADLRDIKYSVEGRRNDNSVPSPFSDISLHFDLYGNIDEKKAARAVELSVTKYCSVGASLKEDIDIRYSFKVHTID